MFLELLLAKPCRFLYGMGGKLLILLRCILVLQLLTEVGEKTWSKCGIPLRDFYERQVLCHELYASGAAVMLSPTWND